MSKLSIIISSCDAFSECWKPIIYSFEKYWPDCEYKKYIISNFKSEEGLKNTEFITIGEDKGWASNTKNAIAQIDADYFMYFQEDYFLCRKVNNEAIKSHLEHCIETGVEFLKINNDTMTRDKARIGRSDYCVNKPNIRYSINTAVGIWTRTALDRVLIPGQTGWDFEHNIIQYLKNKNLTIKSEVLYSKSIPSIGITYIKEGAIVKGMWTPVGVNFLNENGFAEFVPLRKIVGPITTKLGNAANRYKILRYPIWPVLKIFRKYKINI